MRHIWKTLVLLLALVIDSALGSYIGILDISPSFLLVTVIAMAMAGEFAEAGIYGLAAGVLWDLLWGRTFGFYSLLYLYAALGARAFLEMVYKNTPVITAGITFAASLLCEAVLCLVNFTIWGQGNFWYDLFRYIIPTAAYTAIVQMLLFFPITRLSRPKEERGTRL
ncbi:MAG: rod shape-determining protein MreD [Ruminococcaceae bacterium]|nr:rod shape-determining protein MreD [Oscillospiraceae bacterium]